MTFECAESVYAIGSRVSGESKNKKWDFDVAVVRNLKSCSGLRLAVNRDLRHEKDEFGNNIWIDIFIMPQEFIDDFLKTVPHRLL